MSGNEYAFLLSLIFFHEYLKTSVWKKINPQTKMACSKICRCSWYYITPKAKIELYERTKINIYFGLQGFWLCSFYFLHINMQHWKLKQIWNGYNLHVPSSSHNANHSHNDSFELFSYFLAGCVSSFFASRKHQKSTNCQYAYNGSFLFSN